MFVGSTKYWKFHARAALMRAGIWGPVERWRLRWRYQRGQAHESDFRFFRHFDGQTELFVDIGANLGQSALSFRLANRSCAILSFEPNPDMAVSLSMVKGLLGNSFDFRMHGLGARSETKCLYVPVVQGVPFPQFATFRRDALDGNDSVKEMIFEWTHTDRFDIAERLLPQVRFDELNLNPSFVKMDVEGCEYDVVTGMAESIERCRPILMIEGHAAWPALEPMRYGSFVLEPDRDCLRRLQVGESPGNYFYVPMEREMELQHLGAIAPDVGCILHAA